MNTNVSCFTAVMKCDFLTQQDDTSSKILEKHLFSRPCIYTMSFLLYSSVDMST